MCNFRGSGSLQQKFEVMDGLVLQVHVTPQFYLASKGKHILEACGRADPKDQREAPGSILAPLFMFFSPPPEPVLCKLGWPGGLFVLPEVLTPVCRPFFVLFSWPFPFLVFQPPPFGTPFSYSNYLTILTKNVYMHITFSKYGLK